MNQDSLIVTEKDYYRLEALFNSLKEQDREDLELELDRATLVPDNDVPRDVVTMNSTIEYSDLTLNKSGTLTIVFPHEADGHQHKVSVLAPLGSALLGLREGSEINWRFPDGKTHRLKVLKVVYQPERSGDWHL
jgi:regulator of nucleoside diphosphate kinase